MKKIAMLLFLGLIVFSCSSRKVTARKSTPIKHKTERIVKTEKQAELEVEAANAETPSFNTLIVKSTAEYLALFGAIAQEEMRCMVFQQVSLWHKVYWNQIRVRDVFLLKLIIISE